MCPHILTSIFLTDNYEYGVNTLFFLSPHPKHYIYVLTFANKHILPQVDMSNVFFFFSCKVLLFGEHTTFKIIL